jgi:hypothetical protein
MGEAQTLLPVLGSLMLRAQKAALQAAELELEMEQLGQRIFLSGGMHVDVAAAARRRAEREKSVGEAKDTIAEIAAIGVSVHDLQEGLLDIPCVIDGTTAMLCWQVGEETIGHWHEVVEKDSGEVERRPLDARFGRGDRERLN